MRNRFPSAEDGSNITPHLHLNLPYLRGGFEELAFRGALVVMTRIDST